MAKRQERSVKSRGTNGGRLTTCFVARLLLPLYRQCFLPGNTERMRTITCFKSLVNSFEADPVRRQRSFGQNSRQPRPR